MKNKITAVILVMTLLFSSSMILASANNFMLGDVDGNGKITAMDARTALRAAAKIETLSEENAAAADVNFDGKVTAMDARMILRASSRVEPLPEMPSEEVSETEEPTTEESTTEEPTTEEPTTEEPTTEEPTTEEPDTGVVVTEYPEAIQSFFKGVFYLDASMVSGSDYITVKMATNKSGTEILMDSGSAQLSLLSMKSSSYLKIITADGKKYCVELTKTMMDEYGVDFGEMLSGLTFITVTDPTDPVLTKGEYNGEACDVYTFSKEDGSAMVFYCIGDDVVKISAIEADSSVTTEIIVNELTSDIPKTMLTIKGFTKTSILMLPALMPDFAG